MKKIIAIILILILILTVSGCREADKVSRNLSLQADNFNVTRQLTVINQRTDTILFQMRGNFSIKADSDGDLAVTGEDENGRYYKHYIRISSEITYIVEDLDSTRTNKYKYQINFNPRMVIPFEGKIVD